MKQLNLLDVPKDHESAKEKLARFKREVGIWTHSCGPNIGIPDKWDAMLLPGNNHGIKIPYEDHFKSTEPVVIIAGYCRLLEEAGFLTNGRTEREAIEILCRNLGIKFDA